MITPAAVDEFKRTCSALNQAQSTNMNYGIAALKCNADRLGLSLDELSASADDLKRALSGEPHDILAALERARRAVDSLEYQVDDSRWPLPKYREMLFIY
jgi:glutamine synthetase